MMTHNKLAKIRSTIYPDSVKSDVDELVGEAERLRQSLWNINSRVVQAALGLDVIGGEIKAVVEDPK